jgi:translation initiation factor 2B subunit (eIF-2B alpha/beta/delta family)
MAIDAVIEAAVRRLRADTTSGASELVASAVEVLREAGRLDQAGLAGVAQAVGEAQPSMASMWHAALAAVRDGGAPGALDDFERRRRRAGAAMVRAAVVELAPDEGRPLRVATCSFSGSVLACLRATARRAALSVSCAEGRPAFEGRRMAAALAEHGIAVELFVDAGIGEPLWREAGRADAVLLGADAVSPDWVVNKCGSGMLAAVAARLGVPVYVAATRDKFVDARVAGLVRIVDHDSSEVWDHPPPDVAVRNVYFERVSVDLVSGVITDAGTLAGDMIAEACRSACAGIDDRLVGLLSSTRPSVP